LKYIFIFLVFLCISCASNNHGSNYENEHPTIECNISGKDNNSTENENQRLENNCEQPPSNPIGAVIQGGISVAILLALIL